MFRNMRAEPVTTDPRIMLDPERTTLLVIDFQKKLVPHLYNPKEVVKNALLLINLAKIMDIPVLATEQYPEGLGETISIIKKALPKRTRIVPKTSFGCFSDQEFCTSIEQFGEASRTLLVVGIESHICVLQTVLGALSQGYKVHVAGDAVSARSQFNWEVGLRRMDVSGAVISSAEMASYELLQRSDTATFKEFLPVIKKLSQEEITIKT